MSTSIREVQLNLCVMARCQRKIDPLDLIRFVEERFEKDSLSSLRSVGKGVYELTFQTPEQQKAFLKAKRTAVISEQEIIFERLGSPTIKMTVSGFPPQASPHTLINVIGNYGDVLDHKVEYYPGTSVKTGTHVITIEKKKEVPNFLLISDQPIFISYPGVKKVCRRCFKSDHLARDCKTMKCFTCLGKGHVSKDCPQTKGTPDVLPKKAKNPVPAEPRPHSPQCSVAEQEVVAEDKRSQVPAKADPRLCSTQHRDVGKVAEAKGRLRKERPAVSQPDEQPPGANQSDPELDHPDNGPKAAVDPPEERESARTNPEQPQPGSKKLRPRK